ncbi:MAG: DNA alkylation repair protein [Polyangiaceae bacterium]|nr:DNA alkylation repair protein [Myxococcales bacterium]MCB9587191.1 DNA alkylation repair protein [Polyangiaceae bacterium]MCB9609426.1 DNA alkylation repair protein [Polyangiaceae bacterium]
MAATSRWVESIRVGLAALADPEAAEPMRAYMKSELPFLGVQATARRRALRELLPALSSQAELYGLVRTLWRGRARKTDKVFREERYIAMEILTHARFKLLRDASTLTLYEELIVDGAWWDFVDHLAKHGVGELLKRFPGEIMPRILEWSTDADLWKRRSAILCQLDMKQETDTQLLEAVLAANLSDSEFFIRKAVGWALRQYGWVDPDYVERYVKREAKRLSPLSKREALKSLDGARAKLALAANPKGRSLGRGQK